MKAELHNLLYTTAVFLELSSLISACMPESHNPMRKRLEMEERFDIRSPFSLFKRQGCGPAAGGSSCPSGQCCSSAGVCGTGGAFCSAPDCLYQYGPGCDANQVPPGTSTTSTPRPKFGSVPYGVTLLHCTVPGKIALTFDDGPYIYTTQLLDILKKSNVKATFCLTGNNGAKGQVENTNTGYPDIIRRTVAEGHHVVSHSWSHQDLTKATHQSILDQIIRMEVALNDVLGFFPTYFRPPYGFTNADVLSTLSDLGYHILNWDLDTKDWVGDYTAAKNNFNGAVSSGNPKSSSYIALEHDIHLQTVTDLVPYMIQRGQALGYTFTTVGDCLGDPSTNWYRDPITGQPVSATKIGSVTKSLSSNTSNTSGVIPTASVTANFGGTVQSPAALGAGVNITNTTGTSNKNEGLNVGAPNFMIYLIAFIISFCFIA